MGNENIRYALEEEINFVVDPWDQALLHVSIKANLIIEVVN